MMILLTKALRADAYARLLARRTDGTPEAMAAEDARFSDLVARCTGPAAVEVIRAADAAVRAKVRGDFGVEYASEGGYAAEVIDFQGLQVVIENPVGSVRAGVDPDGKAWSTELTADYGYISGTEGADGDMVDVFIGPDKACTTAYVARCQVAGKWSQFDEDKVMLGFSSEAAARDAFLHNYNDPRFLGGLDAMSIEKLKERLQKPGRLAKAVVPLLILAKAHVGPYLRNGKLVNLAGYQGRDAAARASASQASLFSDDEAPKPTRKKAEPARFDHTKTGDLFADTDTAHADGDKWVIPIKDAIAEHAELVAALKSPGKADDREALKEQVGELGRMKSAAKPILIFQSALMRESANAQKGLTPASSSSKIETSGEVPGTARRESGAQEKKMSIPEIKPITYALPASTTGPLAGKTLTGGRSASRVLDGKAVDVVIFPAEENGFDASKYGPEIVVKTPGRPDLIAAVADQKAAKAAAFEAAIPGITEILPLSRKVGNDRARYAEQFNRMMEDEGNDGARPPKLADEAREKLLEEKLAANPRAAQYLRALSFEDASNYMKAAAGSKAKAMLLAGEPTDKAQAEMDDWTGEKAKAAEAAASGARLRSIMTRENGWDVVENMPEFFSPEWKALQGKGYKMYMLGRDGVPVENALNGTIMAKPL